MKRKLRTWVKITIGIASLTALSAAASCSNTALTAVPARPETAMRAVPAGPKIPLRQTAAAGEKHVHPAQPGREADTLYVPQLVKDVVNI